MKTRAEALSNLLFYQLPIEQLAGELKRFAWDSDEVLAVLTPEHLNHVAVRFLREELTAQELEDWANAIESREDIVFIQSHESILQEAIFQLANPLLSKPITPENINALLKALN